MVSQIYSSSTLIFLAVLVAFVGIQGAAKSVVVDDADRRIQYSATGWNVGNTCSGCFAQPDKTQARSGTWHDGTESGSDDLFFTFTFTGTSVELRYIAIDIIERGFTFTTGTNVSYAIDGVQRGTAVRNPADRNAYVYDQSLFKVTGLTNTEHTLKVDLLKPSALLFDYIIYEEVDVVTSSTTSTSESTTSTSTTPSSTSTSTSTSTDTSTSASTSNSVGTSTRSNSTSSTYTSSTGGVVVIEGGLNISSSASSTSFIPVTDVPLAKNSGVNTGPIIGGVVSGVSVLVLIVVLCWFLRRRRSARLHRIAAQPLQETTEGPRPLTVHENGKTMQQLSPNHHHTGPFLPPPSESYTPQSHVSTNTRSIASLDGESEVPFTSRTSNPPPSTLAASSSPPLTPSVTSFNIFPSIPAAPYTSEKTLPVTAPAVRNSAENHYTSLVMTRVQAPLPDEPVEMGLMSRRTSIRSIPPPYSPGSDRIWHDQDAPPLPIREMD